MFHVSKLLPYKRDDPPPPGIIDEEHQEVEDKRVRRGKTQYLVKWRGFPMGENKWMTEQAPHNAQDLLGQFKHRPRGVMFPDSSMLHISSYLRIILSTTSLRLRHWPICTSS